MDVYIARQPIFDRNMNVYGYELLYRHSSINEFVEMDDDIATSHLIYNSFLVVGLDTLTDGKKAFINFSKDMINSHVPYLLPKESVIFEILERKETTQATVEACEKLKSLGYKLALDDFVIDENFLPLFDKVDIIKVEYPSVSLADQRELLDTQKSKLNVKFLAEKIETREDYQIAYDMGYDYFQGYFFSKPVIVNSKEIESLNSNLVSIFEEVQRLEPSYAVIAEIIQRDLGLTYKLMNLANSAFFGAKNRISSVNQALAYIGISEIHLWISLMMLKELENPDNAEMIKLSLIRGKFMELLATELKQGRKTSEYFLTGMFSFIDVLMNQPMQQVLDTLPFSDDVKKALMGEQNAFGELLTLIVECESANWEEVNDRPIINVIGAARFTELYMQALEWAQKLHY